MFLELRNTTVGYQNPLIKGICTSLALGDICLLVGNNGVGKTTLIRSILNQTPLLAGDILLNKISNRAKSAKEMAADIAVVFSKSSIPSNYTARDLISLGKFIHYPYYFELSARDQQEVTDIIADLNLSQYADYHLRELSDGNLQKAFIGRALAQNTPMIILDEPTTHLDEENKIIILKLLRNLAKKHRKLILFSSHDWRLAKEFADKIWLLHDHKLDAGITEDVLLRNNEILNPKLFQFDKQFQPPHISAPAVEKEMLYSFLQKNYRQNLSALDFRFINPYWVITLSKSEHKCLSFEEIGTFINTLT